MDGTWRPDATRDLRTRRRAPASRRRTRGGAASEPTRRLTAPQGAEGSRPGDRPPRRQPPHLSTEPGRRGRASRPARQVLDTGLGGLQGGRRTTNRGGQMTTQAQDTSVRVQTVVDVPIERAFAVFTEQFDAIKPREHNLLAVDIAETVFEPREGGRIYDRGVDGSECQWARVLAYEPPERVVFSWDISPQWQIESDYGKTSEVEARFI